MKISLPPLHHLVPLFLLLLTHVPPSYTLTPSLSHLQSHVVSQLDDQPPPPASHTMTPSESIFVLSTAVLMVLSLTEKFYGVTTNKKWKAVARVFPTYQM